MATKHLDADLSGTPVDQTKYRSMVGALMYLTASRPDIVHATCYCARYQAKPTEKHLTAVKRIFRYLKDSINMGLWLGISLVSWSSKKQTALSNVHHRSQYGLYLRAVLKSYALSWKPCQGDSLNLPDHRIRRGVEASFQRSPGFINHMLKLKLSNQSIQTSDSYSNLSPPIKSLKVPNKESSIGEIIMPPRKAPRTRTTPATTTNTTSVTNAQLQAMIDQGVTAALAARDANRSTNGEDSHNSGTGVRRTERVARECTYQDFMKCQPLYFKGTEGVVELTQWFERMETVFRISNCSMENQTKFSTCTLLASALTWWNSHVMTVGHDVAYAMTWTDLRKKMTDKYCPRNEMKKLETELMFPEESDKIERYVSVLPDMIHGNIIASWPKTIQEAVKMDTKLMDKKISTFAEHQAENKRKLDYNNQAQQQPPKKQGVAIAYTAGSGERKEYIGTLPWCNKCKFHHNGQCTVKCANCKRVGHITRDCRSPAATNNQRNPTCYECGNQGHYRSDCPE
ncbi:reverse transcriptase domain-containing protein [Tanacetum coccineum]